MSAYGTWGGFSGKETQSSIRKEEETGKGQRESIEVDSLLFLDLGGEVVAERTDALIFLGLVVLLLATSGVDVVLNHKRHIRGETEGDGIRQRGGLGEGVQVTKGESLRDFLLHVDLDALLVVGRSILVKDNTSLTDITLEGEGDTALVDGNGDGVSNDGNLAANALELTSGHGDVALVLGVGDSEMLAVDVHELELEVEHAVVVYSREKCVCVRTGIK